MGIHPTAIIDPKSQISSSAHIGPYAVIEGPVSIADDTVIEAAAVISGATSIGANCRVCSGARIGGLPQDMAYRGGESFCRIGDGTVLREGSTVHRGTVPGTTTVVGRHCLIMVNAHIGHNCDLADQVVLVNGALLGGYVSLGSRAIVSGNSVVHQFVRIGELAMVGGLAKVVQDIPPYMTVGRAGRCIGVNSLGLRRAQLTAVERAELGAAFKILYRSGLSLENAIVQLRDELATEPGRQLLAFLMAPSRRGISGAGKRLKHLSE